MEAEDLGAEVPEGVAAVVALDAAGSIKSCTSQQTPPGWSEDPRYGALSASPNSASRADIFMMAFRLIPAGVNFRPNKTASLAGVSVLSCVYVCVLFLYADFAVA